MDKLSQLRIFTRLAERKSFSATARDLAMTQPTVSKAVTELEKELKTRLVNRTTRTVSLTEAGKIYYEHCQRILNHLELADNSMSQLREIPTGTLRITAPTPFGIKFISPRVARFKAMHPGLTIELILDDAPLNLIEHNIDVAIRLGQAKAPGLVGKKLGQSQFICVAAPDYLKQTTLPQHPHELIDHTCIVYTHVERPFEWSFLGLPKKIHVRSSYQSNNFFAMHDAAVTGLGIACLPVWMADSALQSGTLHQVLNSYPLPSFDIHALVPAGRINPIKSKLFVAFMEQELSAIPYFHTAQHFFKPDPSL